MNFLGKNISWIVIGKASLMGFWLCYAAVAVDAAVQILSARWKLQTVMTVGLSPVVTNSKERDKEWKRFQSNFELPINR